MKNTLAVFLLLSFSIFGVAFLPAHALACTSMEKVTVDGITYNRAYTTADPCPAIAVEPQPPEPKPTSGVVLSASAGPAATPHPLAGTISGGTAQAETSALSVAGQLVCGPGQSGGVLGEAYGDFMNNLGSRLGSTALNSVLNGLGNSGTVGRIVSDVFRQGVGSTVTNLGQQGVQAAGSYVGNAVQGAFGNSQLGQAAGRIVGNAANRIVTQVGNNAISSIASQFGQSGAIGGSITNLLGGSGSGVGNIAGQVLQGTGIGSIIAVPISAQTLEHTTSEQLETQNHTLETVNATHELTAQLDARSNIMLRRECLDRQMAMELANQALQTDTENTLRALAPTIAGDLSQIRGVAADSAARGYIDSLTGPNTDARRSALDAFLTDANDPTQPNCNDTNTDPIMAIYSQGTTDGNCRTAGQFGNDLSGLAHAQNSAVQETLLQLTWGLGQRPTGYCATSDGEAIDNVAVEACHAPNRWITQVPASFNHEQLSEAASAPRNRLINTQDVGGIINDAFNSLLDEVFSTVGDTIEGGISGLGNRIGRGGHLGNSGQTSTNLAASGGDTTDTTSGGSYFDQLNPDLTPADRSQLVSQNIANAASVESAYRSTLETMISKLQTVSNIYSGIHTCYQTLANGTPAAITKAEAQTRADTASTTVTVIFQPQIGDKQAALAVSLSTVDKLTILSHQAAGTTDEGDLAALASAYQSLVDAHETHTTAELQTLVSDMQLDGDALQVLGQDAASQLTQCQATH